MERTFPAKVLRAAAERIIEAEETDEAYCKEAKTLLNRLSVKELKAMYLGDDESWDDETNEAAEQITQVAWDLLEEYIAEELGF